MYEYEKPDNLVELIENSVAKYPNNPFFGTKNKNGEYEWVTYGEVGKRVDNLRAGLAGIGIEKGDAVGIIANNRTEWAIIGYAAYGLVGRYIPMYEKELVKIWKHIIVDGGVKVLFVATQAIYDQIKEMQDEFPGLEKIYLIDGEVEGEGENTMAGLEAQGAANPVASIRPNHQDVAALIYTSGTTGNPKGVLLSHGNYTSNFIAASKVFPDMDQNIRVLSILPWAHSFGQTADLHLSTYLGSSIGFMESVVTLGEDMAKVQPTFLIAVPRVFNKIYSGLQTKMDDAGGLAKKLFTMGVEAGKKRRELAVKGESCFLTNLKFKIADKIVFEKIRQKFGGRLKGALSGSATMNVEVGYFFSDLGIPVYDCYGLSETTPAATMNGPYAHRPGSVGRAIDKVKIVIDKFFSDGGDDGEIIIYGPNVMQGYHNKPEATKEVMTEDSGFRTGDRGRLDKDGYLFITGRIKEQYKLENGKYVFPAALEEEIKLNSWVENVMIYGDGRAFNIALIAPELPVLEKYAKENNLPVSHDDLIKNDKVKDMIVESIRTSLKGKFGGYEIPRKFIFLSDTFSLDNGTLTQTMKLKRRIVLDQYMAEIEALYSSK